MLAVLLGTAAVLPPSTASAAPRFDVPAVTDLTLTVAPAGAAAGHERTRTTDLPADALADTAHLQGSPWRATPWRTIPLDTTPWRTIPLVESPWRTIGLDPVPLSALPLREGSWQDVLVGTVYEGVPLQSVTVGQVLALEPLPRAAQELTMADINLDESPWRSTSLAGLLLANIPLRNLPPPGGSWCAFLSGGPGACERGTDPASTTLLELELAGVDLSAYYGEQIDLAQVDFAGTEAPLPDFRLTDIRLDRTPLGEVPSADVPALVTCRPVDCPTLAAAQAAAALDPSWTVGDILALLPVGGLHRLGLGDLLAGIVDGSEIGYEDGPVSAVLDHALIRETDLLEYRVGFTVACEHVDGLELVLVLAHRFRARPDSARLALADGDVVRLPDPVVGPAEEFADADTLPEAETLPGEALHFRPPTGPGGVCADASGGAESAELLVEVEPGATLGTYQATVIASTERDRTAGLTAVHGPTAPVVVDDRHDPGADPETAQPLQVGDLVAGHLATAGDVDLYAVEAPEAGSRLQISLSHLPADYDLVVYGPSAAIPATPWRTIPWRTIPWRTIPVDDGTGQAATDDGEIAPEGAQDLPLLDIPLRGISIRRGTATESVTVPVLDSDRGGRFIVQVSGYNGAYHRKPYILRAHVKPAPGPRPCRERTFTGDGAPGTFPSLPLPASTKTLILVDLERMGDLYGRAEADAMLAELETYAARPDVEGAVIPVESDPNADVRKATDAWDADPCSPSAANAVVGEVNKVVDHVRQGLTELRSIVLVGPDEALPMGRVPDLVAEGNEKEYIEAAVGGKDTAVSRALAAGLLLSDDPYGDFDPQTWLNGSLYVPDVAIGRLIETPDDIVAQLRHYAASDGVLVPDNADVFGYDFLVDGSQAIGSALADQVDTTTRTDDGWTSADARAAIDREEPGYRAVNAHYNHVGALPADAFATGRADILYSTDVDPPAGSILFTVGCHAGLNLPDIAVAMPTPEEQAQLTDWAQAVTRRAALFTGNTGYGYGDTDVVGYSERLLHYYAEGLASAEVTAGQALLFAKQRYVGELGVIGVYDSKVVQQAVFYGLPTYRITEDGKEADSVVPTATIPQKMGQKSATLSDGRTRTTRFEVEPEFERVETDRGTYWTVSGHLPQVTHFRPVQPRLSMDVTADDGLRVHGALIEDLASVDIVGVDPVISRPTIDLSAHEPEPDAQSVAFPSQLQAVNSVQGPRGRQDSLVLMAGQTFAAPGEPHARQRLFERLAGTVYRSDSDDWAPPRIESVEGFVVEDVVVFSTRTTDTDVTRAVVLYRDDEGGRWRKAELRRVADGHWSLGVALRPGATTVREFFVQLVDRAGNVSVSSNKGARFTAADSGGEDELSFTTSPGTPESGFFRESPVITLRGLEPGERASVSVDGAMPFEYEGAFTISGDGVHVLEVVTDRARKAVGYVPIDSTPPEASGRRDPAADGWSTRPVTVSWSCVDAVSGVHTCPEPVTVTTEGRDQTVTGVVTDRAGNTRVVRVDGISIDRTPPKAAFDRPPVVRPGEAVTGAVADDLSGVRRMSLTFTAVPSGAEFTASVELDCASGGRLCAWSAPAPSRTGVYRVTASGLDTAGNHGSAIGSAVVRVRR